MVHASGERDHLLHSPTCLGTGEVVAHPTLEVVRGPYVQDLVRRSSEEVDAGCIGQVCGQAAFGSLPRRHRREVVDQFRVTVYALVAHSFDQAVQHVHRGTRVVQCSVSRPSAGSEQRRQGGQFHRGCLVAREHSPGEFDRAEHLEAGPGDVESTRCGLEKSRVEPGVVCHQYRSASELEKAGENAFDAGSPDKHRRRDAGQLDDVGRDRSARVDEGSEFADDLAASDLDCPDFGDRLRVSAATSGFEVDDDERGGVKRGVEFVERQLDRQAHCDDVRADLRQERRTRRRRASCRSVPIVESRNLSVAGATFRSIGRLHRPTRQRDKDHNDHRLQ